MQSLRANLSERYFGFLYYQVFARPHQTACEARAGLAPVAQCSIVVGIQR